MSAAFVPSRTTDLADIDPTAPTNSQVLVWIASTSKWTPGPGGGNVTSVFGRTGAVVAQAGDYTAAQVGAQASSATLTSLAAASYPSGRILIGAGSGVPSTDANLVWDAAHKWVQAGGFQAGPFAPSPNYSGFGNAALDQTASGNYAIIQDTAGLTIVNAAAAQSIYFRINNSSSVQVTDSKLLVLSGRDLESQDHLVVGTGGDSRGVLRTGSYYSGGAYAGFWVGQSSPDVVNYSFLASNGADGGFPGSPVIYFNAPGTSGVCHFRQNNANVAVIRNSIWTFTNSYSVPYLANVAVSVISFGAGSTPLGIQAASGQTAALTTWYDSTGTAVGWVRPDASLKLPSIADDAAANDSAYYSSTQSTLTYKDSSGVSRPLTGLDTAPADLYVATTGSDTTGDGSSGTPYATVAKALSRLPDVLLRDHTVHVADGTYAYGIDLRRFMSRGDRTLTIAGNTTTPANVVFTGTITVPDTTTCALYVAGPVRVLVQGITANVTATYGVFVDRDAILTLDRCTITAPSSNAISDTAVNITNRSSVEFRGNCTLSNWALNGIGAYTYSLVTYTVAGTLTISRPDSFGAGIHLAYHAAMICQTTGTNISISGAKIGWQLGLHGEFQHIGGSSTLSASNGSTPSSSSGILCTDLSTWSTNQPLSLTHFTTGRESNSISYIEATGGITLSSVTTASSATQNSINNP